MEGNSQAYFSYEFLQANNPFLNFCKASKLLSTVEINEIHKKRLKFEQQVKSANKSTRKNSFLRYIAFELNLLNLIEIRLKQVSYGSDAACRDALMMYTNYIIKIFMRACKNHHNDQILWKSALDFAIKYNVRVREVMNKALQLNTQSADLWLICAKWYAEFSGQPKIARNILQRAIRTCPGNETLWINFLEMECYLAIPSADELIESIDFEDEDEFKTENDNIQEVNTNIKMEENENTITLKEDEMEEEIKKEEDSDEESVNENVLTELETKIFNEETEAPLKTIKIVQKKGKIQKIDLIGHPDKLYSVPNAIIEEILQNSLFKDSTAIRFNILDVIKKFPHTEDFQQKVIQNIISNFADDSLALLKCISFNYSNEMSLISLKQLLGKMIDLVSLVHTEEMWEEIADWCLKIIAELKGDTKKEELLITFLLDSVFKNCNSVSLLSSKMIEKLLNFLDLCTRPDLALKISSDIVKDSNCISNPKLVALHIRFLRLEKKHKKALKFIQSIIYSSNNVLSDEALWESILQMYISYEKDNSVIEKLFRTAILKVPRSDKLCHLYYRWSWINKGNSGAKEARNFIISLSPVPLSTFTFLIDETMQLEGINSVVVDELFEKALLYHGRTSPELWIRKINHLKQTNRSAQIGVIRHRAMNTVEDINVFEELEIVEDGRVY